MKEKIIENGIEYVRDGDYYIPNLKAPEGKFNIGKYGKLHSIFIKENRPCLYSAKCSTELSLPILKRLTQAQKKWLISLSKKCRLSKVLLKSSNQKTKWLGLVQ